MEYLSWKGCTGKLRRRIWTLLKCWDKWDRFQTSRICNLKQPFTKNTLEPHKLSRWWTWHSQDRKYHNQIDYILVRKRFRSEVKVHRTRSFPGSDIGSDHDFVMMSFRVRLKKTKKPTHSEKLRDTSVADTFQATICGKLHHSSTWGRS